MVIRVDEWNKGGSNLVVWRKVGEEEGVYVNDLMDWGVGIHDLGVGRYIHSRGFFL